MCTAYTAYDIVRARVHVCKIAKLRTPVHRGYLWETSTFSSLPSSVLRLRWNSVAPLQLKVNATTEFASAKSNYIIHTHTHTHTHKRHRRFLLETHIQTGKVHICPCPCPCVK